MAYLTIHRLEGNPEELLKKKQEIFDPVVDRIAPDYGAISSVTVKTETGLLIVNLWESTENVKQFMQVPEVIQAQKDAQLPPPVSFEQYTNVYPKLYTQEKKENHT